MFAAKKILVLPSRCVDFVLAGRECNLICCVTNHCVTIGCLLLILDGTVILLLCRVASDGKVCSFDWLENKQKLKFFVWHGCDECDGIVSCV